MKKLSIIIVSLMVSATTFAESAKSILDKAAAAVSAPQGVTANFELRSKQYGSTKGTIAVKGNKFHATTPQATIWFDGTTQWTYMKSNNEVNVSTPTEAELQAINPYNFINIYRKGFKYTAKTVDNSYEVHLTPTGKRGAKQIQEMYIIVNKNTYAPSHVKMRQNGKWSVIVITHLTKTAVSDQLFKFNSKDFPTAEIIDLR